MKTFTRITVDPNQMGGLPCIRSLRTLRYAAEAVRERELPVVGGS
jgi:hypothetical protein